MKVLIHRFRAEEKTQSCAEGPGAREGCGEIPNPEKLFQKVIS
jgi:hypothetical protein